MHEQSKFRYEVNIVPWNSLEIDYYIILPLIWQLEVNPPLSSHQVKFHLINISFQFFISTFKLNFIKFNTYQGIID